MSSSVEKLREIIEKSENIEDVSAIVVVELESGSGKVVELIEALGPWLTDLDKERRVLGSKLLSEVLKLLRKDFLSQSECSLLSAFYCDRLNDHYTVVPAALTGLSALVLMDNLPDSSPVDILISLQKNVMCQTLTVSHRYSFYAIFHNIFVKKKSQVLSQFPSDFLYGLISGMASEADPRNLLFLFTFLPSILGDIPLKHLKEEAFSVLESYFPVDFNPINDKDSISREDLASGLEACLSSTSEFAELCFPMICEKLDSSLTVAQLDSLKLLVSGMKRWGVEALSKNIEDVWSGLRRVLVPGVDPQVSQLAVEALVTLLTAYSVAALGENETRAFSYLLDSISSSTHSYLSDPGLSLFTPTLKLLSAVASVSSATADFIIPRVLPQLIALLESESTSNKEVVLKCLHPFLQSSILFHSWKNESSRSHLEKIAPLLLSLLQNLQISGATILCLTAIHAKLNYADRQTVYEFVLSSATTEASQYTWGESRKFITKMSMKYPEEVEKSILSTFSFPDISCTEKRRKLVEVLLWIMEADTLPLPATKLFLRPISEKDLFLWRADAVFSLRDYICKRENTRVLEILGRKECNFPLALLHSFIDTFGTTEDENAAVSSLLTSLIRTLSCGEQSSIMSDGLKLLNQQIKTTTSPTTELVLMEGLLAGLHPSVEINDSQALYNTLLQFSISAETEQARTSSARLLALLLNKSQNNEDVNNVLEAANILISSGSPASVVLCSWITKALVLRSHHLSSSWLEQLMKFTYDESVGMEAADGVRLVLEESAVLSADNFCSIGFLYNQRVFEKIELLIPPNGRPPKPTSLALAYILKYCPTVLVLGRLEKLMAVMMHCLDDGHENVSIAILEILSTLLSQNKTDLVSYAEDFIPRCLQLASESPYMTVRRQVIDCIYLYAGYKVEDVLPYKQTVVTALQKCLDDKKRLVREAAVRARTRWFIL